MDGYWAPLVTQEHGRTLPGWTAGVAVGVGM